MDIKPRPNHARYLRILRSMSPDRKLQKVFELQDLGRELNYIGLRQRNPAATDAELDKLYLKSIDQCHNRNY
jgi:hypothetical protein